MDYNLINNIEACYIQLSPLLYYSHIPTALVALLLSFFVFRKNRTLATGSLLGISVLFALWNAVDLVLWISVSGQMIMLFWSTVYLIQTLILACTWYFAHAFLDEKDVDFYQKMIMGALLLPLIILMSTHWNLTGFDLVNCEAQQGVLVKYFYFFQGVALLWIFGYLIKKYYKATKKEEKKKIAIFSLGIFLFLVALSWGNVFGSLTLQWDMEQYGLFGMPVFIGFLAFLIVRYKAFDIKLIGAQALVFAQFILIGAMFFFAQSLTSYILVGVTLLGTTLMGWYLIRSVKIEIERKEELQKLSDSLAVANERLNELDLTKSEFISIASHQLRTPLTAIKGYISLLLEGSYGKISAPVQDILNKIYSVNNRLVHLVEDLLNVSRIEAGRIQYSFAPTQLEPLIAELVDMFKPNAKDKHLTLDIRLPKVPLPQIIVDPNKIKEVVSNLIDNSIKYTKVGGTTVTLEGDSRVARIIVSDTGIGIHDEDKKNLFEKFLRSKETTKMVVSGAGLGLYVGKSFITAHGGKIWAESDGPDKGAKFIIELPLVNTKIHVGTSDQPTAPATPTAPTTPATA